MGKQIHKSEETIAGRPITESSFRATDIRCLNGRSATSAQLCFCEDFEAYANLLKRFLSKDGMSPSHEYRRGDDDDDGRPLFDYAQAKREHQRRRNVPSFLPHDVPGYGNGTSSFRADCLVSRQF